MTDEKGLVWPEAIAPFKIHLLSLGDNNEVTSKTEELYQSLLKSNIEVLFDDRRGVSNGEKLNDADLIGCSWRVVVSEKSLTAGGCELKARSKENGEIIGFSELLTKLS
jgi:prolyl-tRNA synthetase